MFKPFLFTMKTLGFGPLIILKIHIILVIFSLIENLVWKSPNGRNIFFHHSTFSSHLHLLLLNHPAKWKKKNPITISIHGGSNEDTIFSIHSIWSDVISSTSNYFFPINSLSFYVKKFEGSDHCTLGMSG